MTTQAIRFGRLVTQDTCEYPEHSIVVQKYDDCIVIAQRGDEILIQDESLGELIKALRDTAKVSP